MNAIPSLVLAASLALITACADRDHTPARSADAAARPEPQTALGRTVGKAMDQARAKLATENINLASVHVTGNGKGLSIGGKDANDNRPKAEITPRGDLLIEGRKVEANPRQQALLRDYRKQVERIASAGIDMGVAGADLGIKAATEALAAVFSGGDPDEVEQRVEAEADSIKLAAQQMCERLPALLDAQQQLAAAMPEFKPYATMDTSDIGDCHDDGHTGR